MNVSLSGLKEKPPYNTCSPEVFPSALVRDSDGESLVVEEVVWRTDFDHGGYDDRDDVDERDFHDVDEEVYDEDIIFDEDQKTCKKKPGNLSGMVSKSFRKLYKA